MDNHTRSESEQPITKKAIAPIDSRNNGKFSCSNDDKINKSCKKSLLNTDPLDDAMQELLDICQMYNDKLSLGPNKEADSSLSSQIPSKELMNDSKYRNDCDNTSKQHGKSPKITLNKQPQQQPWRGSSDDYGSIERLQQKQADYQSQLDEVMQVAKNLALKQKRKLKRIIEDETVEDDLNDDNNDDEDELIEFQQIENELKISEINRHLDNIQEELRVRLYKRLLSNTNQSTKNLQPKAQQTPNRRGSQTDESSPSSSSCSEEPTTSTTSSTEIGISVQAIVDDDKRVQADSFDGSITSQRGTRVSQMDATNSTIEATPSKQEIDNFVDPNQSSIQSSSKQNSQDRDLTHIDRSSRYDNSFNFMSPASSTINPSSLYSSSHINSSVNRDLERIEEDEEDCLDFYNNSEHFRTIYEEKLSPAIYGNKPNGTGMFSMSLPNRKANNTRTYNVETTQNQLGTDFQVDVCKKIAHNAPTNVRSFNSASSVNRRRHLGDDSEAETSRPLTLYLPKPNEEIDLADHIQALGHDLNIISDGLKMDSSSARGYLWKSCSNNSKKWLKRFFYFDRNAKVLAYYENESQLVKKQLSPKNSIGFDEISDVYVDHKLSGIGARDRKCKKQNYVFVLATIGRKYTLASHRAEIMRAWIDVLFTAANTAEYLESFDDTMDINTTDLDTTMSINQSY